MSLGKNTQQQKAHNIFCKGELWWIHRKCTFPLRGKKKHRRKICTSLKRWVEKWRVKNCGMKLCIGNVTVKLVVKNYYLNYLNCKAKAKDLLNMRGCYDRPCGEARWLSIIFSVTCNQIAIKVKIIEKKLGVHFAIERECLGRKDAFNPPSMM